MFQLLDRANRHHDIAELKRHIRRGREDLRATRAREMFALLKRCGLISLKVLSSQLGFVTWYCFTWSGARSEPCASNPMRFLRMHISAQQTRHELHQQHNAD